MADISNNIRKRRISCGMSQAQLAEKTGVTRQTISSWERGASFPDIEMLEKLAIVFNIRIDELLYPGSSEKRKRIVSEPLSFKFVFFSVLVYSFLFIIAGAQFAVPLIQKIVGGGVKETFIIILYWGLILLAGFIAICTRLITEYISEYKNNCAMDNSNNTEIADSKK